MRSARDPNPEVAPGRRIATQHTHAISVKNYVSAFSAREIGDADKACVPLFRSNRQDGVIESDYLPM